MKKKLIDVVYFVGFVVACWLCLLLIHTVNQHKNPEAYIQECETETTTVECISTIIPKETEEVAAVPPTKILDVNMNAPMQNYVFDTCEELNVDFYIVMALIETESGFNPDAVNDNGTCIGYMQVNPTYHSMGMDISAPCSNLYAGISLLHRLLEHSGYDYTWALNAYNGGGAYADGLGETEYTLRIKERANEWR